MSAKKNRVYSPREFAGQVAFNALYTAIATGEYAPGETKVYRERVRDQMIKLLDQLGEQFDFAYIHPTPVSK